MGVQFAERPRLVVLQERRGQRPASAMVSHFLFEASSADPASGVGRSRSRRTSRTPAIGSGSRCRLPSLAALNDWLETRCRELWAQTLHPKPGAIVDVWAGRVDLIPAFAPFDLRRTPTCPDVRSIWTAIATACRRRSPIVRSATGCFRAHRRHRRGQVVCEHRRVFAAHEREEHNNGLRLAALSGGRSTQAGALRNGAFRRTAACLPGSVACSRRRAATTRDSRDLALVLQHDPSRPCSPPSNWRWKAGAPTKTHILNVLPA